MNVLFASQGVFLTDTSSTHRSNTNILILNWLYLEKNIERYCTERACICLTFSTGSCYGAWKLAGWPLDMIFHSKIRTMCFAYVPCSRVRNAGSVHDKVLLGKLPTVFTNLQFCLVFLIVCHIFGNVFITHVFTTTFSRLVPFSLWNQNSPLWWPTKHALGEFIISDPIYLDYMFEFFCFHLSK